MTAEELEALPVGTRIREVMPDDNTVFISDRGSNSVYVKLESGLWDVVSSTSTNFNAYRELAGGTLPPVEAWEFGANDDVATLSVIASEEAVA